MTKICGTCSESKSVTDFYPKKSGKHGVGGSCRECVKRKVLEDHAKHRERNTSRMRRYRQDNLTAARAHDRARYAANPSARLAHVHSWRSRFPQKAKDSCTSWVANNRGTKNASCMKRHAAKLQAVPSWLSKDQLEEIRQIYATCPKGFHVDHIIPLQGENVRGLHVPWNLQHLPAAVNMKKGAKVV